MTLGFPVLCFLAFIALSSLAVLAPRHAAPSQPLWPLQLDASASGADPALRSALACALGTCRGAWARTLVNAALREERDPGVQDALAGALSSIQSRVT